MNHITSSKSSSNPLDQYQHQKFCKLNPLKGLLPGLFIRLGLLSLMATLALLMYPPEASRPAKAGGRHRTDPDKSNEPSRPASSTHPRPAARDSGIRPSRLRPWLSCHGADRARRPAAPGELEAGQRQWKTRLVCGLQPR